MKENDPWNSEYKAMQGNVGLGRAIAYYTSKGIPIMIPLNDTQKYDLVVDKDGLKRVSVKTSKRINTAGNYEVLLKKCGGSSGNAKIKHFDKTTCDLLFILTINGDMYEIPSNIINIKTSLTLTKELDKYKVIF